MNNVMPSKTSVKAIVKILESKKLVCISRMDVESCEEQQNIPDLKQEVRQAGFGAIDYDQRLTIKSPFK